MEKFAARIFRYRIEGIMNSDEQFEAIVSEHYEALFRFAMSLARVEADALDLTQHTFYIWATKGHQLRDWSKVKTWLYTTLHRAFLVGRRKQSRFVEDELEEAVNKLPIEFYGLPEQADASVALRALAEVDPVYQPAVALFYLEDYSYRQIGEILGVPVGTVKSRVARGIIQLRDILQVTPGAAKKSAGARRGGPDLEAGVPAEKPGQATASDQPCSLGL